MGEIARYFFCSYILLGGLLWLLPASAAKPDTEEFAVPLQAVVATKPTPPQRGASRARMVKDATTGETALYAKTAQGAIAAAISQHTAGCRLIGFGDAGFGWVATGVASYAATDNPVADRRGRREARFKAFTEARTRLSGCLRALSPEARRRITETLEQNDAVRLALINLAANDQERWEQALKILARGFVTYAVEDDRAGHTIRVYLVATPKTATRLTRPTATAMEAVSLGEGLKQTQAEVAGRLIPPAGNRLIVVNATGELALVGYAVNLIGAHPDPKAQDKLRTDAEKIATNRAIEALVGLAGGEDAGWQGGLDESSRDEIRADASGYVETEPSVNRFGQIHDLVLSTVKNDSGLQALREGRLPSPATVKRFSDEDTVAVMVSYVPPIKKRQPAPPMRPVAPPPTSPPTPAPVSLSPPPSAEPAPAPAPAPVPVPAPAPAPTVPVSPPSAEPTPAATTPVNPPAVEPTPAATTPVNPLAVEPTPAPASLSPVQPPSAPAR